MLIPTFSSPCRPDSITLTQSDGVTPITMNAQSIAWKTDFDTKFANPASWSNTLPPPFWRHDAMSFPAVQQYPELTQV